MSRNILVNWYMAEWFAIGPDEGFRMARDPVRRCFDFEPIPDLYKDAGDGWRQERRGGAVPTRTLGILGGRLRRVNGRLYLATARRANVEPIDVPSLLEAGVADLWEVVPSRSVEVEPIPPRVDYLPGSFARPRPEPEPKAIPGHARPPDAPAPRPAPARQGSLFGEGQG